MEYSIRPATTEDEPFLWEMLYHAIYVPPGGALPPRDIVKLPAFARYVQDWGQHPDDIGVVAMADGQPIGAAWLRRLTGADGGFGYLDDETPELSIAVLPDHRGQGVGTRLLAHLLEAAQTRYPSVCLSVSVGNPAQRLYERLGFAAVGEASGSLTMRKMLT